MKKIEFFEKKKYHVASAKHASSQGVPSSAGLSIGHNKPVPSQVSAMEQINFLKKFN